MPLRERRIAVIAGSGVEPRIKRIARDVTHRGGGDGLTFGYGRVSPFVGENPAERPLIPEYQNLAVVQGPPRACVGIGGRTRVSGSQHPESTAHAQMGDQGLIFAPNPSHRYFPCLLADVTGRPLVRAMNSGAPPPCRRTARAGHHGRPQSPTNELFETTPHGLDLRNSGICGSAAVGSGGVADGIPEFGVGRPGCLLLSVLGLGRLPARAVRRRV